MAAVHGTLAQYLDDAAAATRKKAAEQGFLLAEGDSNPPGVLVFKKGVSAFSWGSELRVNLKSESPASTSLTISTGETWAITDWAVGEEPPTACSIPWELFTRCVRSIRQRLD